MRGVLTELADHFDVHQLGINYRGDPHDWPWPVYNAGAGGDPHGVRRLAEIVERVRPDVVLLLNDLWILGEYMHVLRRMDRRPRTVMYCPVDAGPLPPPMVERIRGVDRLVTYTQFGRRQLDDAIQRLTRPAEFPEIDVIPHGVDDEFFAPLDRAEARRALFGEDPEHTGAFLVLNANRNQPRKRIDLTMKGFAEFARDKPQGVKLYLHMGTEDAGWSIVPLAERLGIADRLVLTSLLPNIPDVPAVQLRQIYAACDVGLNTSDAEGWGLVAFEHAALGGAQVMTDLGPLRELWAEAAVLVEPALSLTAPKLMTETQVVSPQGVAAALETVYADPGRWAALAQENARFPRYRWPAIGARWRELLDALP